MLILKGPNRYLFTYAIHICVKSSNHTNPASWNVAHNNALEILSPFLQLLSILISQTPWGLRSSLNCSAFWLVQGTFTPGIIPELDCHLSVLNVIFPHIICSLLIPQHLKKDTCLVFLVLSMLPSLLDSPTSMLRRTGQSCEGGGSPGRMW